MAIESELTYKDFAALMRSLKLVSFGLMASSAILVAVGYLGLFVPQADPSLTFPVMPLQVYGGTMLILACVLRFVWLRKISPRLGFSAQEGQLQQRRASFFMAHIITYAVLEGSVIAGFCIAFATHDSSTLLGLGGIAIAMMSVYFPTEEKVRELLGESTRR